MLCVALYNVDVNVHCLSTFQMLFLHMQAARNSTLDQVLDSKPWPEGLRRKAHWDFVLEEMVWMANDFMQVPEFYTKHFSTLYVRAPLHKVNGCDCDLVGGLTYD